MNTPIQASVKQNQSLLNQFNQTLGTMRQKATIRRASALKLGAGVDNNFGVRGPVTSFNADTRVKPKSVRPPDRQKVLAMKAAETALAASMRAWVPGNESMMETPAKSDRFLRWEKATLEKRKPPPCTELDAPLARYVEKTDVLEEQHGILDAAWREKLGRSAHQKAARFLKDLKAQNAAENIGLTERQLVAHMYGKQVQLDERFPQQAHMLVTHETERFPGEKAAKGRAKKSKSKSKKAPKSAW